MTVLVNPEQYSPDELREISRQIGKGKWKRKNKFNACRTIVGGLAFHSKREAEHWLDLKALESAGLIRNLERQIKFELYASTRDGGIVEKCITYIADFRYFDVKKNATVVADSKGCVTPDFRIKKKMMKICHNIDVVLM